MTLKYKKYRNTLEGKENKKIQYSVLSIGINRLDLDFDFEKFLCKRRVNLVPTKLLFTRKPVNPQEKR